MGIFDFLSKKPSNEVNGSVKVKEIMTPNPTVVPGSQQQLPKSRKYLIKIIFGAFMWVILTIISVS